MAYKHLHILIWKVKSRFKSKRNKKSENIYGEYNVVIEILSFFRKMPNGVRRFFWHGCNSLHLSLMFETFFSLTGHNWSYSKPCQQFMNKKTKNTSILSPQKNSLDSSHRQKPTHHMKVVYDLTSTTSELCYIKSNIVTGVRAQPLIYTHFIRSSNFFALKGLCQEIQTNGSGPEQDYWKTGWAAESMHRTICC